MAISKFKQLGFASAGGIVGAALGPTIFGGVFSLVLGTALGMMIGIALSWLLVTEMLAPSWVRWTRMSARIAFVLLTATVVYSLIAGTLVVVLYRPEVSWEVYNRPNQWQGLGIFAIWILSIPSLLTGIWYALRRRWSLAGPWLLSFFGPIIVFVVGDGLTPHLEIPWHQLFHTLVGSLPLASLYWLALRRWHPDIIQIHKLQQSRNMNTSLNREAYMPEPIATRWQRQADRLARYAWYTLLLVLAIGLVGGLISGLIEHGINI